ncbi:Hypothetical predicted protein [Cloeon dipterum]|uniref:Scavenger receptor class B member 1 n=1 Tax=Cloeon dipterum TaxID=197152 RepID=A0A8S1DJK3_9INSE|nr:Hypothetical predicted protein [Cloeon dipterum]
MVDVTLNVTYAPVRVAKPSIAAMNNPPPKGAGKMIGKEDASRCVSIFKTLGLASIMIFAVVSLVGMIVIWKSGLIERVISQQLVIEKDTEVYDVWVKPPVKPIVNIFVFNYTNVAEFTAGKEKLKVKEVGPYVYRLSLEKVRVVFPTNDTVSFQEKKNYQFDPVLTKGSLDDVLMVPSFTVLGTVHKLDKLLGGLPFNPLPDSFFTKEPFEKIKVRDLIWGYDDAIYDTVRPFLNMVSGDLPAKMGLLVGKNSTDEMRFTINTGMQDINKLGIVSAINGKKKLSMWRSNECNRVDGSEGSMFPPPQVASGLRLYIFLAQLCRRIPFDAIKFMVTNGMPAVRYAPPEDVFSPDNPENQCYCLSGKCPKNGLFNVGPCVFDSPTMASFPHFFQGDPSLLDEVEGLKPDAEKHQFYLDVHHKFGVPLGGKSRLQINIVAKAKNIAPMKRFKRDTILPVCWFEVSVDELPPEVKSALKLATHTASHGLMYFLLFVFVFSSGVIAYYATKRTRAKVARPLIYSELPKKLILVQKK